MKGRLFSVTMFVLVSVLGLALPATAAPRPPVKSFTVANWSLTQSTTPPNLRFEALGINWQGYKPAFVELGHWHAETPESPIWVTTDVVLPVNAKAYPYPQNLDLVDSGHMYTVVGEGCLLEQYVRLLDSQQNFLAEVRGPEARYCIVQVPGPLP